MSSIKTYDRTIREPVRYIRTDRAPAPAPPTAAPLYPGQADGDAILDAPDNVALWSTNTSKQTYAAIQLPAHGWGPDQFGCLDSIRVRESGWNELAGHPASAYGIPQADPGRKMAAEGSDWLTNPQTPIRWGGDYIQSRYGIPCQAWAYWQARRYYGPLLAGVLGTD